MTPKFSISIIAFNNLDLTKKCVASVMKHSADFELILTNNGSTDGVGKFFDELAANFPNVSVVHNATNLGYQPPNQKALEMAQGTYAVFLNNDCEVPPNWLVELERPFDQFPKACISGPKDCASSLHPNFHGYRNPKSFEYVEFSTAMLKVEIFRKHGLWIPGIKHSYADDSSTCLRMRELGYTLHLVPIRVLHHGGRTSRFVPDIRKIQEENHAVCRARFAHYLKVRKMDYPIIVKRTAAWGDVLLTTPIIEALKRKYPLSPIHVETACAGIFVRNPHVSSVAPRLPRMPDALTFNLDMAYERRTNVSILQAYADACGLAAGEWETRTRLYPSDHDHSRAARIMGGSSIDWVSMHIGPSTWRSKEWPVDRFAEVAAAIRAMGKKIVLVGAPGKPFAADLDQRGVTTIHEMAALIGRTHLFIGLDSFPLHVAQAMLTPAVGLFGVTDPQYILPPNPSAIGVCGTTESFGVRHRSPNTTVVDDGGVAMSSITAAAVIETIKSFAWVETVA